MVELFSETARRLNPRALGPSRHDAPGDSVRLRVEPRRGTADEQAALEACVAATGAKTRHAGRWLELTCARTRLAELETDIAQLLRAALEAYERSPAPPVLMGIVNVTPDSFSDGGRWASAEAAVEHGLQLAAEGAAWLDVGGESTRPGSDPVGTDEELRRVLPVVEGLAARTDVPVSIDTTKTRVAERALDAGARMVNDVSAGRADDGMLALVARRGCEYTLMHMLGRPKDMQERPNYDSVVDEVIDFLRGRAAACVDAGIAPEKLTLDPGIGFGKRLEDNLELVRRTGELRTLGLPLMYGVSRKSFLAALPAISVPERADLAPAERIGGTAAAVATCVLGGAAILRVHDVAAMAEAADLALALAQS